MLAGTRRLALLVALLLVWLAVAGCGRGKKPDTMDISQSQEPDKILFERAQYELQRKHWTVARLTLQTLINTYPDSDYLAKAKLAIADSYYEEGGTAGLTQAEAEYKDFITIFPMLPEAADAQMRVAMSHYRLMEKPDRDRTHAIRAEEEMKIFLKNYPESPLVQEAEQRLREVQEVLAEGDYRVARFYYIKGSNRAAIPRLREIVDEYPTYSKADRALWMIGQAFERVERPELAASSYSRIITEHPLSKLVPDAKDRLVALKRPVPEPKPEVIARAQKEAEQARKVGLFGRVTGMFKHGPDVSGAQGKLSKPNLESRTGRSAEVPPIPAPPAGSGVVVQTVPETGSTPTGTVTTTPPSTPAPPMAEPPASDPSETKPTPPSAEGATTDPGKEASSTSPPPTPPETSQADTKKKKNKKADPKKESSSKKKSTLKKIITLGQG